MTITKPHILKTTLVAAGLCVGSLIGHAAPLQRSDVIANPGWLLHMDCDSLRPTAIGQYILSEMDKPEIKNRLAAFQTIFNFDPRTQLHGLTLYGTNRAPQDAVMLVYADFDPARIVTLIKGAKDYQSSQHNQHVIHSYIDERKMGTNGFNTRVYASIQDKRIVFGQREAQVAQALDVFDDSTLSLTSGSAFPDLGIAKKHSPFIEAAASKMALSDSNPNAGFLRLSKNVQIVVSESNEQLHGALTLEADNETVAQQAFDILQGLVTLTKMQQGNNPQATQLVDAITVKQDGARVLGNLNLPTSTVIDMMKVGVARMEAFQQAAQAAQANQATK